VEKTNRPLVVSIHFHFVAEVPMKKNELIFAACSFAALLAVTLFAQEKISVATSDEIQVKQLERAWNEAEARHDMVAVTNLVADSLSYIDFDGSIKNKAEYLKDVTETSYQADHLYDEGLNVTAYGNAAVVVGVYRETGKSKGKPYTHHVRFTDTWIKLNGVWRCVASQSTLIQ
jgi:ketosteroid isomerase-like protein